MWAATHLLSSHAAAGAGATAQAESGCSPLSDSPPRLRAQRASTLVACGRPGPRSTLGAALLQGPADAGLVDNAAGARLVAGPADTQPGAAADIESHIIARGPAGAPQCDAPPATGPNAEARSLEALCSRAQGWRRIVCRLAPALPPHFVAVSGGPGAGGGALLRARMGPLDADGRSYAFDEVRVLPSKLYTCCITGKLHFILNAEPGAHAHASLCLPHRISTQVLLTGAPADDPNSMYFCMYAQVLLPGAPAEALAAQAAPLVTAALAGGTAAALALGRSGSGKTWCLSGCRPQHAGEAAWIASGNNMWMG